MPDTPQPQATARIEPVVYLLTGLVVFFTFALFAAERYFKDDAVFFQSIVGILTTASGALFMKIKTDNTPQSPQVPQVPQIPQLPQTEDPAVVKDGFGATGKVDHPVTPTVAP